MMVTYLIKRREKSTKLKGNLKKSPYVFKHVQTITSICQDHKENILIHVKKKHGKGTYLVLEKDGQKPLRKIFYGLIE